VVLGFYDPSFAVALPVIRYDMGIGVQQVGIVIFVNSIFYTLSGAMFGHMSLRMKPESVNLLGLFTLMLGIASLSLVVDIVSLAAFAGLVGMGSGMIDSSLNSYMARNFSSRYMSWLHCSWSIGATISPIIMSQMILLANWRMGYISLAALQGIVAAFVLASILRGAWGTRDINQPHATHTAQARPHLTHWRYQFINIAIFFVYMGMDYSLGLWLASLMIESRGLDISAAAVYPAVYFASLMLGRIASGWLAKHFSNMALIRAGLTLAVAGILLLIHSDSIVGVALAGLGFAPVYPCLMHDTARLFNPAILTKLIGQQVAAAGMGVALLAPAIGLLLSYVSLEALFPLTIGLAALVFILNELTEIGIKHAGANSI